MLRAELERCECRLDSRLTARQRTPSRKSRDFRQKERSPRLDSRTEGLRVARRLLSALFVILTLRNLPTALVLFNLSPHNAQLEGKMRLRKQLCLLTATARGESQLHADFLLAGLYFISGQRNSLSVQTATNSHIASECAPQFMVHARWQDARELTSSRNYLRALSCYQTQSSSAKGMSCISVQISLLCSLNPSSIT